MLVFSSAERTSMRQSAALRQKYTSSYLWNRVLRRELRAVYDFSFVAVFFRANRRLRLTLWRWRFTFCLLLLRAIGSPSWDSRFRFIPDGRRDAKLPSDQRERISATTAPSEPASPSSSDSTGGSAATRASRRRATASDTSSKRRATAPSTPARTTLARRRKGS